MFRRKEIVGYRLLRREDPPARLARPFLLGGHLRFKPVQVHLQPALRAHQLREVDWKAVGVIQAKGVTSGDSPILGNSLEHLQPPVERLPEPFFLRPNDPGDVIGLFRHLGKHVPHDFHDNGHQPVNERIVHFQRAPVTRRTPQDSAQHVPPPFVGRQHSVRNCKTERADVVGDYPHRHPMFIAAGFPGHTADRGKNGLKQIGIVSGFHPLEHGTDALEPHAGIHVFIRKRMQNALWIPVELDEDQIPDFQRIGTVEVRNLSEPRRGIVPQVVVYLRTRTARTGLAHLPEIVCLVQPKHPFRGEVRHCRPERFRLLVRRQSVASVTAEYRGAETILWQLPDVGQQFPGPRDGLPLEIVSERPVAQHFEKRMVLRTEAHLFQVVVMPRYADAFLGIHRPAVIPAAGAQKHVLELIHPRVRKQQGGIVLRRHGRAGHDRMTLPYEKAEKFLADVG